MLSADASEVAVTTSGGRGGETFSGTDELACVLRRGGGDAAGEKKSSLALPQSIKVFEDPSVLLLPGVITPIQAGFERYGAQGNAAFNIVLNAVKLGLTESIHDAILLSLGLMIFTFILVCFLKEIPLRKRDKN